MGDVRSSVNDMREGRGGRSLVRALLLFLLIASVAAGCARARAADVPVGPPLAIPAPPERVLVPVQEEPLATSPGRTDPVIVAPEVTSPQRLPAAAARPPAEQTRQTPQPPPPATPPASGPAAAEVTRQVRPQASAEEAAVRSEVTQLLSTVKANLNRISETSGNRQQLEEIRVLSAEAENALTKRDYEFARIQANKAVTLSQALLR